MGLTEQQKEKHREAQKRYREKNRAKINEQNRLYRQKYPEKMKEFRKQWNRANTLKIRLAVKDWNRRNPDKVAAENYANQHNLEVGSECELCPEDDVVIKSLQKHHPDHSYPEIFVGVCSSCHKYAEEGV